MDEQSQIKLAELVRIMHKELGWVVKNLAKVYDMLRTESSPALEDEIDPRQLSLFNDESDETRGK